MDFGPQNVMFYALLRCLPVAAVIRFIARPRIRSSEANLPRSFLGGFLGIYACWHVGRAAANGDWNPLWGLIPVAIAELSGYLSAVLELKQDCAARRGSKFILPDGREVWLRKTAPLTGVLAGLIGALSLLPIGRQARIDFLVALFRQNAVVIGLNIVGVIALLDIPFMLSRISSAPSKG